MADGGMAVAGLVLAVPGVIDICIKYGCFLRDKVRNYQHIKELARVGQFIVELVDGQVHQILLFFTAQHQASAEDSQAFALVQQLRNLLEKISKMFPGSDPGLWERLVFSMHGRDSIERACVELEEWHGRLLRHFFLRAMLGAPEIHKGRDSTEIRFAMLSRVQRIRKAIMDPDATVDARGLRLEAFDDAATFQPLDGSDIVLVDSGKELVEYRQYSTLATPQVIAATQVLVREIAARLHEAESATKGLLCCKGFTPEPMKSRFALRFNYPAGRDAPKTLQSLLMHPANAGGTRHSLSDRVALARGIASAVLYMHTCGFVHKSIRPDNILIFEKEVVNTGADQSKHHYPYVVGEPFLVGFDSLRRAVAASNMIKVEEWKKNVYLHPDRHRMTKGDEYTVRHDLYSLGVVLLEVAMWSCFTDERANGMAKCVWHVAQGARLSPLSPDELKAIYLKLAKSQVPRCIGAKYADIVVSCLEGLRDEEAGGLLNDQDGMVVETAYVSQILEKLEDISL